MRILRSKVSAMRVASEELSVRLGHTLHGKVSFDGSGICSMALLIAKMYDEDYQEVKDDLETQTLALVNSK